MIKTGHWMTKFTWMEPKCKMARKLLMVSLLVKDIDTRKLFHVGIHH